MMQAHVPPTLPYQGRQLNYAGVGRTPGSHMYLDATTGRTLELFYGQLEQLGPVFGLAVVAGNQALGRVRVDNTLLNGHQAQVGSVLLLGPIEFVPAGPKAHAAWPARLVPSNGDGAPARKHGVITQVAPAGTYGWISDERTGTAVFVHRTQLRRGATLMVGLRVSYVAAQNERGLAAFDVGPA
jgi:cold shock CspA family protein